ncbi:MAG: DEAD/DEAH box helicase [Nitrospinae bacterium]|nr:DEAD/DEAH box helicase [Nitrospinota bacterium]
MAFAVSDFIEELKRRREIGANIIHHRAIPGKTPDYADLPENIHPALRQKLSGMGLSRVYSHQAQAIESAIRGENVIVATPTASGKTLCYTVPVINEILNDKNSTALFLFPLKALARDQLKSFNELCYGLPQGIQAEVFDGDVRPHVRKRIMTSVPRVIFTNPDMLHLSMLPGHGKWEEFFKRLKYIVVDEAHTYRGVFGSHVAQVFRRLARITESYRSNPSFIACSATIKNPGSFAETLTGKMFTVVDNSGAPRPGGHFIFYNTEGSPYTDASRLFRYSVNAGFKTIAFTKARKITELIYTWSIQAEPELAGRIGNYRAGFLPEERRKIENDLFTGKMDGVITTSALEMGVDIGGLDVCVLVGYPGSIINTWQRGGRVGRGDREFLIIMVAQPDALDQHFIKNPDDFFNRGFEAAILDPGNVNILKAHIACAAAELPITPEDKQFNPTTFKTLFAEMEGEGKLALSIENSRWLSRRLRPWRDVDIRSAGETFAIFGPDGKTVIGKISGSRVYSEGHEGAVYLHMGRQYIVKKLDLEKKAIHVAPMDERYYTRPRSEKETEILETLNVKQVGGYKVSLGRLKVTEQVTGYEKRSIFGQESLGVFDLSMPLTEFETVGFWIELDDATREEVERRGYGFMGGIHAFEHASIALFPLFALCDRDDIGGISYPHYPGIGKPAIFFYDGYPGGVGLSEAGFNQAEDLWRDTLKLVSECPCDEGCPSCIHSPKCGSGNKPLDKRGAKLILEYICGIKKPSGERAGPDITVTAPLTTPSVKEETVYYNPAPDKRIVFFDLETQKGANEVGGWDKLDAMRLAVGVVYDSIEKKYIRYWEKDAPGLIEKLIEADLVVGFNHVRFDYGVLAAYTKADLKRETKNFDIMLDVWNRLGHRLSLDHLATATLNRGKTADGLQSLKWWADGEHEMVAVYCESDVEVTKTLFEFGLENQHLIYRMKSGEAVRLQLEWDLDKIIASAAQQAKTAPQRKIKF